MRIFAVDPGLSGAWALIVAGKADRCGDLPVVGEGARRNVSPAVIANHMVAMRPDLCVIERAQAMPKQGVASTFKYGVAFGTVLGAVGALHIAVEYVAPPVWKRHFRLIGADKDASRQKALELAPWLSSMLDRQRDHGRAEAVLIGLYGVAAFDHSVGEVAA